MVETGPAPPFAGGFNPGLRLLFHALTKATIQASWRYLATCCGLLLPLLTILML